MNIDNDRKKDPCCDFLHQPSPYKMKNFAGTDLQRSTNSVRLRKRNILAELQ